MASKLFQLISFLAETQSVEVRDPGQVSTDLDNTIPGFRVPNIVSEDLGAENQSREIDSQTRLQTALESIRLGADQERVARYLSWKEFEDLAAYVLSSNHFQTLTNVRIGAGRRKTEIDVVGVKPPIVLCVDCKHWSYGWSRSRLASAAVSQMIRCERLASVGLEFLDGLGRDCLRVGSILVTLADVSFRSLNGVAVVPILRLRSFLNDLSPYSRSLKWTSPQRTVSSSLSE